MEFPIGLRRYTEKLLARDSAQTAWQRGRNRAKSSQIH